jgi:hypothetical protein
MYTRFTLIAVSTLWVTGLGLTAAPAPQKAAPKASAGSVVVYKSPT